MCGATTGVTTDHDGYACLVCGSPRVPVTEPIERPRAERPLLERAKHRRMQRAGWGVAASLSMAFGGVFLVLGAIAALVFDFGTTAQAAYGALVIAILFFSALGFYRSRRAGRDARSAIEAAQSVVAAELIAARGTIEAGELAGLLKISVERAEGFLAAAQVERMLQGGERVRVEEPARAPEVDAAPLDAQERTQRRE